MAYRNFYRVIISNDYLGISKEISAPNRYELERKIENQKRIWNERVQRELIKQTKDEMKQTAEKMTALDQKIINYYENIIKNINIKTSDEYYNSMVKNEKYKKFSTDLKAPSIEEVYEDLKVPKKSFLEKIFKSKMEKRKQKEAEAEQAFLLRTNYYNKKLKEQQEKYENDKNSFYAEQENHNKNVYELRKKFDDQDIEQIEKYYEYVLESSDYPEDFTKDYEIQYIKDRKLMVISYYLPNEETIPRIIQHKFVSTRNEIDEIKLTDKKFEKFYNDIIYMCSLRTIKEIFESDDSNYIDEIVFNGWIKYVDKSTGNNAESCILTLDVNKDKFNEINLDSVDYKSCIKGLKGIFAPNILDLTPVVPYLNINREDSRFIDNKEAKNITMDGYNLATMPWEDFEYFVRELFDKMFNKNGGEVKVTQASHDGGVDAIAFDDDPIRGGKFVIQAKRYNNVVSVSAVRDLYGTMIHEGATKGILVTTSSYGKDAYEFAKDKPIALIDGSALLGLLNQYGYSNLTIKIEKK